MLIIISPAKKLQDVKNIRKGLTNIEFPKQSSYLISELRKLNVEEISSLMNISPKLGELNFERYINWSYPFTNREGGAALYLFNGDVYRGMQTADFEEEDIQFAQQHLRILSGLYGLIKPLDHIMPYRLEMGTKLINESGKNLYEFWNNKISERLNLYLKKQEDDILINLASNEYFKAVKKNQIKGKIISPVFKENKNGDYKIIGIHAKRARGLMCRYIIKNKLRNTEDLKGFDYENYSFNHDLSSEKEFVFTR